MKNDHICYFLKEKKKYQRDHVNMQIPKRFFPKEKICILLCYKIK